MSNPTNIPLCPAWCTFGRSHGCDSTQKDTGRVRVTTPRVHGLPFRTRVGATRSR